MIDRPVTLAATGLVISGEHRDPFEQGGFAGAVFTGDDRDRLVKTHLEVIVQERKAERIGRAVVNARWIEPGKAPASELCDFVLSSCTPLRADVSRPWALLSASEHNRNISRGKGVLANGVSPTTSSQMRLMQQGYVVRIMPHPRA